SSPFPKGVAGGYVDGLPQYAYDPDKAKALLAQAGYPDGFSFNFKAPDGRYLQDKAVAEAITGQLAKVGIKAELETVEWSTYVQGIVGRKYELFLLSQGGLQIGPAVQTNWSSRIKGIAWQGYTNPQVDDMIDTAAKQVDGKQRQAAGAGMRYPDRRRISTRGCGAPDGPAKKSTTSGSSPAAHPPCTSNRQCRACMSYWRVASSRISDRAWQLFRV